VWGPTDGCIGMVNEDVELVYDAVPVGTSVVIEP
jgi:lipoprotein-anchoring transpeptidase ErfK/SrfK